MLLSNAAGSVVDEEGGEGWELWDEAPNGQFSKIMVPPRPRSFPIDRQPTGHEHRFYFAVEFAVPVERALVPKSRPCKKQQTTTAAM